MNCQQLIEYGPLSAALKADNEKMLGELLTFIEAVLPAGKQCEAVKSNVKQIIWRSHNQSISKIGAMTPAIKEERTWPTL